MPRTTIHQTVAAFLKAKREALGLSTTEAADQVFGKTNAQGHLSKIESGKQKITLDTLERFSLAYQFDLDFREK